MYFPYLTARSNEVEAIISTVCKFEDNKVIVVLEPYNDDEDEFYSYSKLIKLVRKLIESQKKFVLKIENESDLNILKLNFSNLDKYCIHGYDSNNLNYLKANDNVELAIIHENRRQIIEDDAKIIYHIFMPSVLRFETYIKNYPINKVVLIEDAFQNHEPNSEFPNMEDFNSELCFTYKSKGIAGFGDFTILPEDFQQSNGGNQMYITHVIHITRKLNEINRLVVHHFLTTPAMEPDIRLRSINTIKQVIDNQHLFQNTIGIKMLISKFPNPTSLGMYKCIGIAHHIDLMHSLL